MGYLPTSGEWDSPGPMGGGYAPAGSAYDNVCMLPPLQCESTARGKDWAYQVSSLACCVQRN